MVMVKGGGEEMVLWDRVPYVHSCISILATVR